VSSEVATLMDIFPTILELANISAPKGVTLDGKSMSPILFNNGASEHEFVYHWRGGLKIVHILIPILTQVSRHTVFSATWKLQSAFLDTR
jgi:arylsulfatase A-like enzyme